MADQAGYSLPASAAPALVGRERERALLRAALDAALAGHGSLVLIGGEAGIGKTALAEALLAEAQGRGATVLVGRCYDLSETPPYGPWLETARGYRPSGDLPAPPAFVRDPSTLQALAGAAALHAEAVAFFTATAVARPLVLLLEDLHWSDPASLDLLRVLARHLAGVPLLLLATFRGDEVAREHLLATLQPLLVREARATRLDLRPLDMAAIGALVSARYTLTLADRERLVAYLAGRTEGNALFVGELLRTLEGEGALHLAQERWALGDLAAVPVPVLLHQVIDGRLRRLPRETEYLLAVAAVIGQEVPLALWATVAETDEGILLEHAQRALSARLLAETRDGVGVRFAHALIREVLYAGIPVLQRRTLHRRVADALLSVVGNVSDPDAIASHLGRAGDRREFDWLVRAGEQALARHAPQGALDRLSRALKLAEHRGIAPPPNLHRARGLAHETLGDFAGALADHEVALAAARAAGDVRAMWRSRLDLGQLWSARDYARAGEHYAHALAAARTFDDPAALADSLNRLGNWLVNTGHPWEGVRYHREALMLLEERGNRGDLADTLDLLGMAEWIGTGEAVAAVRDFGRAIDLLRTLDLPQQLSSCLASRCGAAGAATFEPVGTSLWPPAACLRDAEEAERLAGTADWPAGRAYPAFLIGQILTASGAFGPALAQLAGALDLATAIDHRQWLAGTRCALGQLHVLLLAPDAAREHLDPALALARDLGSSWWVAYASAYLALAHVQLGDLSRAGRAYASPRRVRAGVAHTTPLCEDSRV